MYAQDKDIQNEIRLSREKLKNAKVKEKSTIDELEGINKDLVNVKEEIRKLKQQSDGIDKKIKDLRAGIAENEKELVKNRALLKKRLQMLQRYGYNFDYAVLILNIDDFYSFLRLSKYLTKISEIEYKKFLEYKETSQKLQDKEKNLKALLLELNDKNDKTQAKQEALTGNKKKREAIFLAVKKEQILYKSMLQELESTNNHVERVIDNSVQKGVQTAATSEDFRSLKGALQWPVDGNLAIPYGTYQDPKFNTPVFRNGIYIKSQEDADVRAIYTGKVVFADWFKGLGQVVILDHGDGYHTVYANLSRMSASVGSLIKSMEKVGNSGDSGVLEGAGIYFELRYNGKPINPLQWLSKK